MNPLILSQIFDAFILFYAGLTVMLCYQIFGAYRRRFRPKGLILLVEELLFWFFAALLTSSFLYYACYGKLSFHAIVAFAAGAAVWQLFFGPWLSALWRSLRRLFSRRPRPGREDAGVR